MVLHETQFDGLVESSFRVGLFASSRLCVLCGDVNLAVSGTWKENEISASKNVQSKHIVSSLTH